MGTPTIYWTPTGAPAIQAITLPRVTRLVALESREIHDSAPIGGTPLRTDLGGLLRVSIEVGGLQDTQGHAALVRSLHSLISHLRRGGVCGFSLDHAKSVGWFGRQPLAWGATSLPLLRQTSAFGAWQSSGALAVGDELEIVDLESQARLISTYASLSGSALGLGEAAPEAIGALSFARYRWFFPALWLPEDSAREAELISSRDGQLRIWTLALTLQEYPAYLLALRESAAQVLAAERSAGAGGLSLEVAVSTQLGAADQGLQLQVSDWVSRVGRGGYTRRGGY